MNFENPYQNINSQETKEKKPEEPKNPEPKQETPSVSESSQRSPENLNEKDKIDLKYIFNFFNYSEHQIEEMKKRGVDQSIGFNIINLKYETRYETRKEGGFLSNFEELSSDIKEWVISLLIERSIANDEPLEREIFPLILDSCSNEYFKKAFANINFHPLGEDFNKKKVKILLERYEAKFNSEQGQSLLEEGKNKIKLFLEQEGVPSQEASFLAHQDILTINLYRKGILNKEKLSSYINAIGQEAYSVPLEPSLFLNKPFVSRREIVLYERWDELNNEEVFDMLHHCDEYFLNKFFNELSVSDDKKFDAQCFNNFIRLFNKIRWDTIRAKSSRKEFYYKDYTDKSAIEKLEKRAQQYLDKLRLSHGVAENKITSSMVEKILPLSDVPEETKEGWVTERYKDLFTDKSDIEYAHSLTTKLGGIKYSHTTQLDIESGLDKFVFALLTEKNNPYAEEVEFVIDKKLVELAAFCTYNDIMDIKCVYSVLEKDFSFLPADIQGEKIKQEYERQKIKLSQLKYLLAELDEDDYRDYANYFGGINIKNFYNWNGFEIKLPAVGMEKVEKIVVNSEKTRESLFAKGFPRDKIVIKAENRK